MGKTNKKIEPKIIGYFGVDSGQVMIGDPCYLGKFKNDEYRDKQVGKSNYSYSGACKETMSKEQGGTLKNDIGAEMAVVASTGFGDGSYPVIAHYENYGENGQDDIRIKKLEILFIQ
jgi:hypothetical protein